MRTVSMFEAFDGKVFHTQKECMEYEKTIDGLEKIYEFAASEANPYKSGAHRSLCLKIVFAWEQWRKENE